MDLIELSNSITMLEESINSRLKTLEVKFDKILSEIEKSNKLIENYNTHSIKLLSSIKLNESMDQVKQDLNRIAQAAPTENIEKVLDNKVTYKKADEKKYFISSWNNNIDIELGPGKVFKFQNIFVPYNYGEELAEKGSDKNINKANFAYSLIKNNIAELERIKTILSSPGDISETDLSNYKTKSEKLETELKKYNKFKYYFDEYNRNIVHL